MKSGVRITQLLFSGQGKQKITHSTQQIQLSRFALYRQNWWELRVMWGSCANRVHATYPAYPSWISCRARYYYDVNWSRIIKTLSITFVNKMYESRMRRARFKHTHFWPLTRTSRKRRSRKCVQKKNSPAPRRPWRHGYRVRVTVAKSQSRKVIPHDLWTHRTLKLMLAGETSCKHKSFVARYEFWYLQIMSR